MADLRDAKREKTMDHLMVDLMADPKECSKERCSAGLKVNERALPKDVQMELHLAEMTAQKMALMMAEPMVHSMAWQRVPQRAAMKD